MRWPAVLFSSPRCGASSWRGCSVLSLPTGRSWWLRGRGGQSAKWADPLCVRAQPPGGASTCSWEPLRIPLATTVASASRGVRAAERSSGRPPPPWLPLLSPAGPHVGVKCPFLIGIWSFPSTPRGLGSTASFPLMQGGQGRLPQICRGVAGHHRANPSQLLGKEARELALVDPFSVAGPRASPGQSVRARRRAQSWGPSPGGLGLGSLRQRQSPPTPGSLTPFSGKPSSRPLFQAACCSLCGKGVVAGVSLGCCPACTPWSPHTIPASALMLGIWSPACLAVSSLWFRRG